MGLWDLIKEGAEFVGDKYKDFSGIQIEKCALNQNFNFSLNV